jgi:hypothetical protein
MDDKDYLMTSYVDHAPSYEEEYAKPYQKPYQEHQQRLVNKKHKKQFDEDLSRLKKEKIQAIKPNATPLSKSELEYLFWNKLVVLGWKKATNGEVYSLMLICPNCDKAIVSRAAQALTYDNAYKLCDKAYVSSEFNDHNNRCEPFEYDENGDVVEATPEAKPFGSFLAGTTRYDTVDDEMKIFDGERWIAHKE